VRQTIPGFLLRCPGFDSKPGHVGFVMGEVRQSRQVFSNFPCQFSSTHSTSLIIHTPATHSLYANSLVLSQIRTQALTLDMSTWHNIGSDIALAVSHRFPTAEAGVQSQAMSCWICGGQSGTGIGSVRLLWFSLSPSNLSPWSESASELYRPSDRRLSAK
jgi:hypothetical protein